jgi:hypothetical protein
LADTFSYGGVRLTEEGVVIEIDPGAVEGRRAVNDAELRSLLGHEILHGYQCRRGPCEGGAELWRREIEAFEWELAHFEPEVGRIYREDTAKNLAMYRAMVAD